MAVVYRVEHVMGGATGYRFSFSYSESGVLSLNFHVGICVLRAVYDLAKRASE
jgi:hypothetical protein